MARSGHLERTKARDRGNPAPRNGGPTLFPRTAVAALSRNPLMEPGPRTDTRGVWRARLRRGSLPILSSHAIERALAGVALGASLGLLASGGMFVLSGGGPVRYGIALIAAGWRLRRSTAHRRGSMATILVVGSATSLAGGFVLA